MLQYKNDAIHQIRKPSYNTIDVLFIGLVLLVTVRCFSFTLISDIYFDILEIIIVVVLAYYSFLINIKINTPFAFYVKAIVILTLLSSLSAFFFHQQNFILSLFASRTIFFWLFYYFLHKINIDTNKLEKILLFFGIVWSLIMILQQITYPNILFNAYDGVTYENGEDRNVEVRGGITRIMIAGIGFSYFMVAYMWQKLQEKISIKNMLLIALVMIGIILTQSRQIIFGIVLIFIVDTFLSFRINNKKSLKFTVIFMLLGVIFLAIAGDFLFALIELSQEQDLTSGSYIRGLEIEFFLFKYWPDTLCYIIGNGWEHAHSPYGLEMKETIQRSMGFHRSDIGLIGAFNKFGILYVVVVVAFYVMITIPRKHFIIPKYIRIVFILCAITSLSGANFFELSSFFVPFTCLFYITDKTNEKYINHYSYSQQDTAHAERA